MSDLAQRLSTALADRYRIECELGRGGMATVFLAEDLKHRRQVALKVLDPEVAAAIGPERFLREIATVAKLTHPHVLPLFDSGQAGGLLFYVMPFVEGESLRQRLEREKQLPLDDALRIAREVADALGYAHVHGLVHRDVKPENVLLESGHAVVADFGIARAVAATGRETLTATGVTVGTPAYMSPEQAAGSRDIDGRSDLYSLGCVLYEMLAGVPPFTGVTAESLVRQHLNASPRPVTELRPAVPASVAAALQRALAKTPADRFGSATRFAEALAVIPDGIATSAPTVTTAPTPAPRPHRLRWLAGAAVIVVLLAAGAWLVRGPLSRLAGVRHEAAPAHARTEIAVLPFQNLSAEGPHAYFAGGLHEELLTQLAKVAALKVISRTSVMGYAASTKPLKQVASELGVGSIVEGSVQVAGNRLRVNVQLIDAATDEHLWAERYDRTLDDAFAIQSEVAQQVVAAVGVALAAAERLAITAIPTASPEAYRLYLQGNEYFHRPGHQREHLERAQDLHERALALDPDFALAHAALSRVHGEMYWFEYDPRPDRVHRQREAAARALHLAPRSPEAHVAMSSVYAVQGELRRAAVECEIALRARPGDAEIWEEWGLRQRRLGNWAMVDSAYRRAAQLDPRNANVFYQLGALTFEFTRRYPEAVQAYDRALAVAPDLWVAACLKGRLYLRWKGSPDTLRAALAAMPDDAQVAAQWRTKLDWKAYLLLMQRQGDSLLAVLSARPEDERAYVGLFQPALYEAYAHRLRGDERAARAAFASALAATTRRPTAGLVGWEVHVLRGMALAGLGRKAPALEEVRWLLNPAALREDQMDGSLVAETRARILAQLGEAEPALDEIERLLAGPSYLTSHILRLDLVWDPIREHPRFKALLIKYADPEKWAVR